MSMPRSPALAATQQDNIQQENIARLVSRVFSDIRHEMDEIINCATLESLEALARSAQQSGSTSGASAAASRQAVAQAILQLHGRTQSESPGYYDYELPNPILKLPEVPELASLSTVQDACLVSQQDAIVGPGAPAASDAAAEAGDPSTWNSVGSSTVVSAEAAAAVPGTNPSHVAAAAAAAGTGDGVFAAAADVSMHISAAAEQAESAAVGHAGGEAATAVEASPASGKEISTTRQAQSGLAEAFSPAELQDSRLSAQGSAQTTPGPMQTRLAPAEAIALLQERLELEQLQHSSSGAALNKADLLQSAPAALSFKEQHAVNQGRSDGGVEYVQEGELGRPEQQLSYKELLDRALAWNPRTRSAGHSTSSMMRASAELPRSTEDRAALLSTTGSSRRQRPLSAGRAVGSRVSPPRDNRAKLLSAPLSSDHQGLSKFPGAVHSSSHFSLSEQARGYGWAPPAAAAAGGGRIFKESVTAGTQAVHRTGSGAQDTGGVKAKPRYRSRSAPREEAAARRHIERMNASPTRAGTAQRDSILAQQQQQQQLYTSWKRESPGRQGISSSIGGGRATLSAGARKASARSPEGQTPMRLTQDEWNRVNTRLHQYTSGKQDRPSQQQQQQQAAAYSPGARSPSTSPRPGDRLAGGLASSAAAAAAAAAPLDPEFYRRQNALLRKRAELAAKKRPSDEDDLHECTFHPQINKSSQSLQRSVEQLHAWDARRKLTVFAKALDKCEHECEGYTFAPTINPLSRQLALANYAVAPDPARPWTTSTCTSKQPLVSPRHTSPSPEAVRMLRDTLPPANVIMMAGPTAQQKAESVMNMLGVAPSSAATGSVHFSPRLSSSGNGTARRSPSPSSRPLGQHVSTQGEQQEQQLQHGEKEEQEDCGGSSSRGNGTAGDSEQQTAAAALSVTTDTQQALASSKQDTTQPPELAFDVVVGVPVKMPAVGIPVNDAAGSAMAVPRSSAVGNNGDGGSTQQASAALPAVFDSAVQVQGCLPLADKQGSVAQPGGIADAQQAPSMKEGFAAPAAAAAGATVVATAPAAASTATTTTAAATTADKAKGQLEPQVLLAALKLSPAQPQQALGGSKGDSGSSSAGGSAPARGSSSGGMAPGTPVLGSLGGSGSSGGGNGGMLTKPARGRDESAGGAYTNALARKLSAGSGLLPAPSAFGHKPGSSPLSRAQPSEKDSSNSAGAAADSSISQGTTLQELASQLGCSPDKAVQQLRVSGLQTVPAYFYGTADNRNVAVDVRRPGSSSSSYSQKYQKKVIKLASQDAAAALPPELLELMNSLAAADGSSAGAAEPSSFAQLKAAWLAKESASRETSGAGARPANGGSLRASAAGAGQDGGASAAGGQSGPSGPLLLSLSSSLVAPGTPVHSQLHPFATMGSLLSQYSNAQLLNARMQHSLSGDGSGLSINGGPHGIIGDPLPKATGDEACSSGSGAVAAAAVQAGPALSDKHVLLLVKDPAASSTRESLQGVGQGESSQALAACSSILSLPDAAAGAAAVVRDSCNGCPQAQTVEKVEILLEGTRSVPFELVLSPRSKYLIASSTAGGCGSGPTSIDVNSPLGQHLLQLVLAGRLSEGASGQGASQPFSLSLTQWQQLLMQQQQERQAVQSAAEPAAVMGTPAGPSVGVPVSHSSSRSSSSAVDAVTQVLAGPGCSPEVPSVSAGAAMGATPCCSSPSGAQAAPAAAPVPIQLGASGQLVLSLLRPSAASPRLANSNAGTPVWGSPSSSSHQLAAPQQQQVPAAADAAASSSAATGSFGRFVVARTASLDQDLDRPSLSATGAVAAALGTPSPHQQQQPQQQLVLSSSPFQQQQQVLQERQSPPQQQQQVSDGGAGDLAAELVALLQSAGSMSPEEKADRVARTFAKTISRLNMSSDVLQQTIAALDTSTPAASSSTAAPPPAATLSAQTAGASLAAAAAPGVTICDIPQAASVHQQQQQGVAAALQQDLQQQQHLAALQAAATAATTEAVVPPMWSAAVPQAAAAGASPAPDSSAAGAAQPTASPRSMSWAAIVAATRSMAS